MTIVVELILALLPLALKWLADLLNKHAAAVQPTGDHAADAKALLTCALEDRDLFGHPFRRAVVAFLLAVAPKSIASGTPLSDYDREILTALAARTDG